jgi:hypothetical protein
MAYRYCPECEKWLETNEYTVNKNGETVCPKHKAVHGYIGGAYGAYTVKDFHRDNKRSLYDNWNTMLNRAMEQGIVD